MAALAPARASRRRPAASGRKAGLHAPRHTAVRVAAVVLALLVGGGASSAQEVSFRAEVEATTVGIEDTFPLIITIEGRSIDLKGEISTPELSNLEIVGGPSVSTRVSFVNGAISQARQYTLILRPTALGPARIGPVQAQLGGRDRTTEPIALEVVPGSRVRSRPRPADPFDMFGQEDPFEAMFGRQRPEPVHAKVLMVAEASRPHVFVGEPVLLTYFLYTQAAVAGLEPEEAPKFPGFWSEELPAPEREQPRGERVERDGEPFQRFVVLQRLLYPTRAGVLEIPAAGFRLGIPQRGGFFDPGFGRTAVITRRTEPIKITVDPLPSDPAFTGAVGTLRASADLDRSVVEVGEAATLRFSIEGTGNLRWIDKAPSVDIPGVRVYPPQVKTEVKASPSGLSGRRTWEYVLIPETAGAHRIPSIPFTYLDTSKRRLVSTATPPLVLAAGASAAQPAATAALPVAVAAPVTADLRLRDALEAHRPLAGRGVGTWLAVLLGLSVLAHALIRGWPPGGVSIHDGRPGLARTRTARKALSELRRAGRGELSKEAAAILVEQVLVDLFGELAERPAEDDSERDRELKGILRDARFVRYAPQLGDYSDKLREVAERAAAAVRRWA
ncbi:MAG TPA: BatD family protein [Thermoanaerobaculaceae bacterium]|nr:BatD family protein [Thermoanaerobaculaceae bacterium]HRS15329.1 BatD family protein [Thermoanaerobaculaceae bacterium]